MAVCDYYNFLKKLNELDHEIRFASGYPDDCQSLPLPGYVGKNYLTKRILFVGQSPGQPGLKHEDGYWAGEHHYNKNMSISELRKHYFQGLVRCNIGQFVQGLISQCGLTFDDIAFTNVVKCAIKNNDFPKRETIEFWAPYLVKQLELLEPKFIICLGRLAKDFFQKHFNLKNFNFFDIAIHRVLFDYVVLLFLPHPAYIGKQPELIEKAKEKFKEAYAKVMTT